MPKPKGSGVFAAAFGVLFFVAFVATFIPGFSVSPYTVFKAWLLFVSGVLLWWGGYRVAKGSADYAVGQDTITFVVSLIGATIALYALVTPSSLR